LTRLTDTSGVNPNGREAIKIAKPSSFQELLALLKKLAMN
jgi:hypothetical protein